MDTVIPAEVLEHIRSVAHKMDDTEGWWTTRQLAEAMGVSHQTVRARLRAIRDRIEIRRFALTQEEALALGNLGAGGMIMYRFIDEEQAA